MATTNKTSIDLFRSHVARGLSGSDTCAFGMASWDMQFFVPDASLALYAFKFISDNAPAAMHIIIMARDERLASIPLWR